MLERLSTGTSPAKSSSAASSAGARSTTPTKNYGSIFMHDVEEHTKSMYKAYQRQKQPEIDVDSDGLPDAFEELYDTQKDESDWPLMDCSSLFLYAHASSPCSNHLHFQLSPICW